MNWRVKPQTVPRTLTTKTFRALVLPPYQRKQLHCCPSFGKICQVLVADNIVCYHGAEKWVILKSEADASTASGLVSRAPQLFAALPPWPNSTCTSHPSHPSHPPLHPPSQPSDMSKLAPAMAALNRSGDALDLLGEANDDAKRLEVLALPIAALVLLELASAMLRVGLMLRDAQRCSDSGASFWGLA